MSGRAAPVGALAEAGQVFGLVGFVVSAPLLATLGDNPTFFVAHNIDGGRLALFAIALVLIPPLVPIAVLWGSRLLVSRAAPFIAAAVIGSLTALALVPPVDRELGMSTATFVVVAFLVAVIASFAYQRWRAVRTYATYLAPAPLLFLAAFLFASPTSVLLGDVNAAAAAADLHGSRTPVVFLVLDELPLGVLLDEQGGIDAARYPGFARLASMSTWYRRATTVAPWTHLAVPAILTGQLPTSPVPVASTHPRSLFTLLGRSHELHVSEAFTQICPAALCGSHPPDETALVEDSAIVYLHSLLPAHLEDAWLPPIGERWAGFTKDNEQLPQDGKDLTYDVFKLQESVTVFSSDEVGRFAAFLKSIEPTASRPGLWFHHALLPHLPYQYLPDGHAYKANLAGFKPPSRQVWGQDTDVLSLAAQRLALQTGFVDGLVSSFLDRLAAQHILDDALVVVTADHGFTFEPGRQQRGGTEEEPNVAAPLDERVRDEVLPVPLFVKYPGQAGGVVDDRAAQNTDILPTIVDALRIDLPADWRFSGRSLRSKRGGHRPQVFVAGTELQQTLTVTGRADARRMAQYFHAILGSGGGTHDLYRLAPFGNLVGTDPASLPIGSPVARAELAKPHAYDNVDLRHRIPALLEAVVNGLSTDDWVAVAVNGTIAGTGPVYEDDGFLLVQAMLDPSLLRSGRNQVDLYRIDDGGRALRPVRIQVTRDAGAGGT
jgi:hypothetical protein